MSMFGPKMGTWWVESKLDPRWNTNGKGYGLVVTGGPGEINQWIAQCEKTFGKKPDDLEIGFMKD